MQFVNEVQSALGVGRTFHIDAHKSRRLHGCRFRHQAGNNVAGQLLVDVQSHVGQLQADVGVEAVGRDGVENLVVEFGAFAGFVGIGDVLAQIVDTDAHASAVDRLSDAYGVGDLGAGDEAPGNAASDRGALGKAAQRTVFRKTDEEGP